MRKAMLFALPAMVGTTLSATRVTAQVTRPRPPVASPVPTPRPPRVVATTAEDTLTSQFDVEGIPVILRRVTANNVVAANLYLLGGTRQLTPATQGVEMLLLEASERGTKKYPRDLLRAKMARLGSAIGVSPGADWTTIGLRATTTGFDSTWAILADRLAAPTLAPADVELVREQFHTAVKQRKDSPDALLDYLADSIALAGHPYALEPVGTEESLTKLTTADVKAYQASQIVSSRMMLVVVGNVSRGKIERLVRETLGRLPLDLAA